MFVLCLHCPYLTMSIVQTAIVDHTVHRPLPENSTWVTLRLLGLTLCLSVVTFLIVQFMLKIEVSSRRGSDLFQAVCANKICTVWNALSNTRYADNSWALQSRTQQFCVVASPVSSLRILSMPAKCSAHSIPVWNQCN